MAREYKDSGIEWIGRIPKEWEVKKVKYLADTISKGNGITKEEVFVDGDIQCVRYGEIYSKYDGSFKQCQSLTYRDLHKTPRYFQKGDILFAGTGELVEEIGKNIVYLGDDKCLAGGDIIILSHHQNASFLNYAMNSYYAQCQKSRGKAKLKVVHISASEIGDINVILPPLSEQRQIADYLDEKCGEIDALIALQEQMIAQLTDYKQSVITEAVTKGLDPNVTLVPSGIDWIGDVPKGWKVVPFKWILRKPLQYGANESGVLFDEQLPRYVRITDISNNGLREDLQKLSLTEEQALGYILEDNDILFARSGATVGKAFIYKQKYGRCAFAGYLIRAQVKDNIIPDFVFYYTQSQSYDEWKRQIFIQATIQNIGADRYSILDVPLPPLSEQRAIASYLDTKCSEIDSLVSLKQQKIETLKDYKKSVIYEAVTGKMELGCAPRKGYEMSATSAPTS